MWNFFHINLKHTAECFSKYFVLIVTLIYLTAPGAEMDIVLWQGCQPFIYS